MSSVFVAVVLLGFAGIALLLVIHKMICKKRSNMKQFLQRFNELGAYYDLTFSSQEILQDAAIGLDGIQRKLLVLTGNTQKSAFNQLVDLSHIKACVVKKEYIKIQAGLRSDNLEDLEKISLCFELKSGKPQVEVMFYHHATGYVYQVREMTRKARHWEAILSKMLKSPFKEAAS